MQKNLALASRSAYERRPWRIMSNYPITPAVRVLREHKVPFSVHIYAYEERGGTALSSEKLGADEHSIIKTLVMEDEHKSPLIVLMHGDKQVSLKLLAKALNCKMISPCSPESANKHSGYLVGGTSPFGTKKAMPVFMEKTILDLPKVLINGGKRGFLVGMNPIDIQRICKAVLVEVGI